MLQSTYKLPVYCSLLVRFWSLHLEVYSVSELSNYTQSVRLNTVEKSEMSSGSSESL